ncbi:MAG: LysR family transcriptional regulator [Deltaproteobacteria bacterium]|nr:LysR family transcriptional regulator [Deltaproteobacteria bacterium]
MIETRHLEIFLAIWELESFSRAAEQVHLTQPTVSGHIKALEEQFRVRLFNREGRRVTPTRAGRLLYPYARKIIALQQQALQEMVLFVGEEKGTLEIGGSTIPGAYLLPPAIGRFKSGKPAVKVLLKIGDTAAIAEAVAAGELELGMVGAVFPQANLVYDPCLVDELVLVTAPDSELAARESITPAELQHYPMIIREKGSGTRETLEEALQRQGAPPLSRFHVIAEMGSTEAVRQAAKAGVGAAVISRLAVREDLRQGLLAAPRLTGLDLQRQFYLVRAKNRTLSPLAADFHRFITRECPGG